MESLFEELNMEIKRLKNIVEFQNEMLENIAKAIIGIINTVNEYEKDIYNTNKIDGIKQKKDTKND